MKPKARTKKRTKSDPWHPLPSLKDASGVWQGVSAGESAAASGGGRRSVLTEAMALPGGHGWLVRTIVSSSTGSEAVALCFVPKR